MLTREDRKHSHTIASDGELFVYLIPYQNLFVTSQIVLFVASNKDLIATSTVFRISTTSNIGVSIISLHDTPKLHTLKRVIRNLIVWRTYK